MKFLYLSLFFVCLCHISVAQKMRPVIAFADQQKSNVTKEGYNLVWADEFDRLDTTIWNRSYPGNDNWASTAPDFCKKCADCVAAKKNVEHLPKEGMVRCWFTASGKGDYCKYNYGEIKTFSTDVSEKFNNWRIMPDSYTEVRLKLPACEGIGAAFWLYGLEGNGKTAKIYEIDIFELYGVGGAYRFQSDLHFGNCYDCKNKQKWHNGVEISPINERGEPIAIGDQFLTFGIAYNRTSIDYYLNGNLYYKNILPKRGKKAKYLEPLSCFIRLGTGRALGGTPDACKQLPVAMDIDYVRLYRKKSDKAIFFRPGNNTIELCNAHAWNSGTEVRVTFLPEVKYSWSSDPGFTFEPYTSLVNELKSWWVSADHKLPIGTYKAILKSEFPSGLVETMPLEIKVVNEPWLPVPEVGTNPESFSSKLRVRTDQNANGYEWSYDNGMTWEKQQNLNGEAYQRAPKTISGKKPKAGNVKVRAYNQCFTSGEATL